MGDLEGLVVWEVNKVTNKARTSLQLPLRQWNAGNVYLLELFGKYCQKPIAVTGGRYVWARPAGIPTEAFINPVLKRGPLSRL